MHTAWAPCGRPPMVLLQHSPLFQPHVIRRSSPTNAFCRGLGPSQTLPLLVLLGPCWWRGRLHIAFADQNAVIHELHNRLGKFARLFHTVCQFDPPLAPGRAEILMNCLDLPDRTRDAGTHTSNNSATPGHGHKTTTPEHHNTTKQYHTGRSVRKKSLRHCAPWITHMHSLYLVIPKGCTQLHQYYTCSSGAIVMCCCFSFNYLSLWLWRCWGCYNTHNTGTTPTTTPQKHTATTLQ